MKNKNIQEISDSYMCSVCGACELICPKDAITFAESVMGRLYPKVSDNCVDCEQCLKYCPSIAAQQIEGKYNEGFILNTYVGRTTNDSYYKNAQSGGACIATIKYMLELGHIDGALMVRMDYGATPEVKAVLVENSDDLAKCQKSCYTAVPLLSLLSNCREKKSLAIVGLPCQMRAITKLQEGKRLQNVSYKIGLICDGTMTSKAQDALISFSFNKKEAMYKIDWKNKCLTNVNGGGTGMHSLVYILALDKIQPCPISIALPLKICSHTHDAKFAMTS